VRRDGPVLLLGDIRNINEGVRPQRLTHFVERDARDGQVGKEAFVALHELAECAREGQMIGVDFDGTGDADQVGLERREVLADRAGDGVVEPAIGKTKKVDVYIAEDFETAPRFFFATAAVVISITDRRVGFRTVRRDHNADGTTFAKMFRDEAAAADHLVIGMGSEHEKPFAEESRCIVRNGFRLDEHVEWIICAVAALA